MNPLDKKIDKCYESIYPICPKRDKCATGNLSKKPKKPYIGRNYGLLEHIPKILFVSLDSGDDQNNYTTIDDIRKRTESEPPRKDVGKESGRHWPQTFEIGELILDLFLDESLKAGEYYGDSYIAHTNSAKCCQSKEHRKQADNDLFVNCKDFVIEELKEFKADIIITQGAKGSDVLNTFPTTEPVKSFRTVHNNKEVKLYILIREIEGKKCIHIPMYHQSYYRGYWGQKKALVDNLEQLKEIYKSIK